MLSDGFHRLSKRHGSSRIWLVFLAEWLALGLGLLLMLEAGIATSPYLGQGARLLALCIAPPAFLVGGFWGRTLWRPRFRGLVFGTLGYFGSIAVVSLALHPQSRLVDVLPPEAMVAPIGIMVGLWLTRGTRAVNADVAINGAAPDQTIPHAGFSA